MYNAGVKKPKLGGKWEFAFFVLQKQQMPASQSLPFGINPETGIHCELWFWSFSFVLVILNLFSSAKKLIFFVRKNRLGRQISEIDDMEPTAENISKENHIHHYLIFCIDSVALVEIDRKVVGWHLELKKFFNHGLRWEMVLVRFTGWPISMLNQPNKTTMYTQGNNGCK